MRKLMILILVMGLVGTASAADVTYHFTAQIKGYSDGTGIFGQLGYNENMTIEGTITIDPEATALYVYQPDDVGGFGWYGDGRVAFANQGYEWEEDCKENLLITNFAAVDSAGMPYHRTELLVTQARLNQVEGIQLVSQKVILENDGLDVSIPADLNLGSYAEYVATILTDQGESSLTATITSIMDGDEYAASQVQPDITVEPGVVAARVQQKPQFRTRKNETLYKRIRNANDKLHDDNPNNDKAAMSELRAFYSQVEKRKAQGGIDPKESEAFDQLLAPVKEDEHLSGQGKKKK